MATRQAWARWAAVLAAALLAAPGCSSEPEPSQGNTGQATEKGVSIAPSSSQAEPPRELTLDLGGGVTMKLALIPAGKFMMGDNMLEKRQRKVTISKPFYMGVTEVTQEQYDAVMGTNPSQFKGATNPVDNVTWNEATAFCRALTEKIDKAVRLPSEAEWEYACRAESKAQFSFGDAVEGLNDYAWYDANSSNTTHPVGRKKPNAWGLYDMHGNVWEWCADWEGPNVPGSTIGALRGGAWNYTAFNCRCAFRDKGFNPGNRGGIVGFRVVVSVSAPGL